MARTFKVPFAATGDKVTVPVPVQPDGSVSWTQGYGFDYQRDLKTDPQAKVFPRAQHNQILGDITESLFEIQLNGFALWSPDAAPYPANAVVRHAGSAWRSTENTNSTVPGEPGAAWVSSTFQPEATEETAGVIKISNQAQVSIGTDDKTAITPLKLARKTQSSPTDTVSGKLLTVGAFGLGGYGGGPLVSLNSAATPGFYRYAATDPGRPSAVGGAGGSVLVNSGGGDAVQQLVMTTLTTTSDPFLGLRSFDSAGNPGPWTTVYHSGNLLQATQANLGLVRIATAQQAAAGTDDATVITPLKLKSAVIPAIGFTPVQQGTGVGQTGNNNVIKIGYSIGNTVKVTVDSTDFGSIITDKSIPTETTYGAMKVATSAEVSGGGDDSVAVTPRKLRLGFAASFNANGYIVFPFWLGSLIIQWGSQVAQPSAASVYAFPVAFTGRYFAGGAQGSATNAATDSTARLITRSLSTFSLKGSFTSDFVADWWAIGF